MNKFPSRACFSSPPKDLSLYTMAQCFDIPVRGAHDALMDAFLTAQIFQRYIPLLIETGIQQIGDLLSIGNPAEGGEPFRARSEITNF